ncbi:hypothetical protein X975_12865, partial [Stegodyphus mimosarum]
MTLVSYTAQTVFATSAALVSWLNSKCKICRKYSSLSNNISSCFVCAVDRMNSELEKDMLLLMQDYKLSHNNGITDNELFSTQCWVTISKRYKLTHTFYFLSLK